MGCTCNSIRENGSGMSYSLAMLGVNCGYCEAEAEEWEWRERRAQMTEAERVAEDIATRWSLARFHLDRAVRPGKGLFGFGGGWF